jgi:hypothetical protein
LVVSLQHLRQRSPNMKKICLILCFIITVSVSAQDKKETATYFEYIKEILSSEKFGSKLVYRLDTLTSKFIPSRSGVNDYLNREIEFVLAP